MPYDQTTIQTPFWAKSGTFTRGRDPLGVENSSFLVVATLLPGITNQTQRIRYYGFYMWLLGRYEALPEDHRFRATYKQQYRFIRRAELAIAYASVHYDPQAQAIIGSDFPYSRRPQPNKEGYFDLVKDADLKTREHTDVYWSFSSGGMGQYYAGAFIALGLIQRSDDYFFLTERGKELGAAFGKGISDKGEQTLIRVIDDGKLWPRQREELMDFLPVRDILDSEEWRAYRALLMSSDSPLENEPTYFRKETLGLFLAHIASDSDLAYHEMPRWLYDQRGLIGQPEESATSIGWYLFYLNELLHVALQGIFYGLLKELESRPWNLSEFIEACLSSLLEELKQSNADFGEMKLSDVIDHPRGEDLTDHDYVDELFQKTKSGESLEAMDISMILILNLYRDHKEHMAKLWEFSVNNGPLNTRGSVFWVFAQIVEPYLERSFSEFYRELLREVLMGHVYVAYGKMGNGDKNLLKFIIENDALHHIETMYPAFTNPRLHSVRRFMRDMGMLDLEDGLTESGIQLLDELSA